MSRLKDFGSTFVSLWSNPVLTILIAFLLYALLSMEKGSLFDVTVKGYYSYLADAFNHGQLNLRLIPESSLDLIIFNGKYYLYWAPFPAVLLMPLVALFGVGISDVFITVLLASLNAGLLALLLSNLDRKNILPLGQLPRGLLILFFIAGSVQLPLAFRGLVWSIGQLTGFLFVALSYLSAINLRGWPAFLLTGLAIGCAAATRNNLLFTGLWPIFYLISTHWKIGRKKLATNVLIGLAPVLLIIAGLAWYNAARFGSPLDFGLKYHNMSNFFRADYEKYGIFSSHYIKTNIYYQYIYYPFPWSNHSYMGGSLFLLSPILFAALWGVFKGQSRISVFFLVVSIIITMIPILLLMGTGWVQFGPRYTLDFHVPLIMLTAMGIKRWPVWLIVLFVFISCVHYLLGIQFFLGVWK